MEYFVQQQQNIQLSHIHIEHSAKYVLYYKIHLNKLKTEMMQIMFSDFVLISFGLL
jgi:hypothetical protein